ncbi:MAG TPA: transposase [Chloroflexi bacterium]|nr:transposase [Chloroflexota bacterium]
MGALLRWEGLYSSHLTEWRRQRASGEWEGKGATVRGCKPTPAAQEVARLQRENERLRSQLGQAELIISAPKKLALALEHIVVQPVCTRCP